MIDPKDVEKLAKQLGGDASLEVKKALIEAVLSGQTLGMFGAPSAKTQPDVRPAPKTVRGFRIRVDLKGSKPPVWRRLEVPGDLTLPRVHDAIQAAMGWTDSHLHQFRTGNDPRSPHFVTHFDLDEGEDGVLEDGVRLDQLVAAKGDRLGYTYDFGDDWDHVLRVEAVLDEPPATVRCTGGRMACPPEDCGGLWGYRELAAWVRSSYDAALLPDVFDDVAAARDWLPLDWHPDEFDLDQANADLAGVTAEPIAVSAELAGPAEQLEHPVIRP